MQSTRHEFASLFSLYVAIAAVVAALIFGVVAFAVLRYRHREGEEREPSPRREARRLELVYALIVAAVIAVVLSRTLSTESAVDATVPRAGGGPAALAQEETADTLTVDVMAFQWGWRFTYPDAGFGVVGDDRDPPLLRVPVDRRVSFELRARDVIHSFWVPAQRFKRDAIPGRVNRFDLFFEELGRQPGLCAEFCGLRHADMRFEVEVMLGTEFDAWLASHQATLIEREAGSPEPPGSAVEVSP